MLIQNEKIKAKMVTRRQVLGWSALAGLGLSFGSQAFSTGASRFKALDHLILGVNDLDEGIQFLEEHTGVRAIYGGSHPNSGTRNALISLGKRQYLELLAPDPDQNEIHSSLGFIKTLREPKLFGWMVGTEDIDLLAKRLKSINALGTQVGSGSRERPDGQLMEWRIALVSLPDIFTGLIQWSPETPHPAVDSPGGCSLLDFSIRHPEHEKIKNIMRTLDFGAKVQKATHPSIHAKILTPKGELVL